MKTKAYTHNITDHILVTITLDANVDAAAFHSQPVIRILAAATAVSHFHN